MTKRECLIIMANTGIVFCPFAEFHIYAEKLLGRPILNIEFGQKDLCDELAKRSNNEFREILDNVWRKEN